MSGYSGTDCQIPSVPSSFAPGHGEGLEDKGCGNGTWTSVEQLVTVPVRPFTFTEAPQTITAGGQYGVLEYHGSISKPHRPGEAEFYLLRGVLTENEAAQLLATCSQALSEAIGSGKGRDLDVDGRPRFAVEVAELGVLDGKGSALRPLVETVLLPLVRQKYGQTAALSSACFRRFVPEERRFIPPHQEYDSFAVMTIALQESASYTGGFFLQGSGKAFVDRKFLQLGRGDLCIFQYDLCHGVDVQEGSHLELVLHFKDSPQAVADGSCPWYSKMVEVGDPDGLFGHALSLVKKDFPAAKEFVEKACEQDHVEALYTAAEWFWDSPFGLEESQNSSASVELWRRAAELGHCRSRSRLGSLLMQGVPGRLQQDIWEGKRLLRLAFEQDDPDAAFHLGQALLQDGDRDGVTKLLAACAKGHPRACFQVAELYREGQFQFPKDLRQSVRYTKWAAHQGDAQALSNLGHLLINGMGVVKDEAKAVRLFRHAAKLGAAEGMLNYGLALLRGSGGVKVDYQEALEWAQKSAALGHSLAHQQLSTFFNAAKNPNPPARCVPSSMQELCSLGVKELRDLLRLEGIDFSDCIEKSDLLARAALHLPGVTEPWDAAPEHTMLLEPKRINKEILRQRGQLPSQGCQGNGKSGADRDPTALDGAIKQGATSSGTQRSEVIPGLSQAEKLPEVFELAD
ncbi:unnamed protein product [Durusdinium trenchii]|uniref:Fe2OG dioxygenase domain-containing protein n=1 Tax=Durusdinium trenchii TaxID=1381693 RepID=A0ABP0HUI0_9DINO